MVSVIGYQLSGRGEGKRRHLDRIYRIDGMEGEREREGLDRIDRMADREESYTSHISHLKSTSPKGLFSAEFLV